MRRQREVYVAAYLAGGDQETQIGRISGGVSGFDGAKAIPLEHM